MASILRGGLAFALILLIIVSTTFQTISVAEARHNHVRKLASDCPIQQDGGGCGGGGGSKSKSKSKSKPKPPGGPAPGSSSCKNSCCKRDKMGQCVCC
ncbi:hypothetical protein QVD17_32203 [Tagetes erecta]|uniref:Uncharacterized protein n=1 Tax=Tagetes erecta TaxID=13708 RepID=A0AAD8K978_TARER|nr:hypothetical protein QVD17_32203 [Tagetes erecta]